MKNQGAISGSTNAIVAFIGAENAKY